MKRFVATAFLSLGFAVASAVAAAPAFADVDDFSFQSFSADYTLSRADDGTALLTTVETFVADFPDFDQNRGIIRNIPDNYDGVPLNPEVTSIVDESGNDVPYEESTDSGVLVLALGTDDYVHGATTYTITYTQHNVVRSFDDTDADEFFWDTNGVGFGQPFGSVTARVHVDQTLTDALTGNSACYQGEQGSADTCEITQSADDTGAALFTAGASDLGPGENVTVAIGFTKGTFVVPDPPQAPAWATIVPLILIGLILIGIIATIVVRVRGSQGAPGRGYIIAEYSVPDDVNLLVAGALVGRVSSSMPAQLVSFAVRGNIQIIDDNDDDYSVAYLSHAGVDEQEGRVLTALFGKDPQPGTVRSVGGTNNSLAKTLVRITGETPAIMKSRGWKESARLGPGLIMLAVMAVLGLAALALFAVIAVVSPVVPAAAGGLLVVALVGFVVGAFCAYRPPVFTREGADMRDYIRGLEVYLKLAEADRFKMLQSPEGALRINVQDRSQVVKLYEKLLPFAVLWGVEKEWAEELAVQYQEESPSWYVGRSGFNAVLFGSAVSGFSTSASSVTTVASSGGGSFSGGSMGGGFSGGGGGGGGGGGR